MLGGQQGNNGTNSRPQKEKNKQLKKNKHFTFGGKVQELYGTF